MITFVPKELTAPVWRTIDLGDGASIEIAVKRPTLAEQLNALEDVRGESVQAFQLRSRIIDWRGVNDEAGKPVPYSWANLSQLSLTFPNAIWDILIAVREAIDQTETHAKNCESPPLAGGTETTTAAASTTESLNSTGTSDESEGSAKNST